MTPGPGYYNLDQKEKNNKYSGLLKSKDNFLHKIPTQALSDIYIDERTKHSLFDTIEKKAEEVPDPSKYSSHGSMLKRTYNATLPPKKYL